MEKGALPDWASKIIEFRTAALKILQGEMARRLELSQASISDWERGRKEPSADSYRLLTTLAGDEFPEFASFFGQKYLKLSGGEEFLQRFARQQLPRERKRREAAEDALAGTNIAIIPLLKDAAACGTPRQIDETEIKDRLALPKQLFRGYSGGLYAITIEGDSMSPILEPGYIVLVDTSQRDPKRLVNQMVAARADDGVTIKWLRKERDVYMLVPHHTAIRHPVRIIAPGSDSVSVVGRVVKWIGEPPAPRK